MAKWAFNKVHEEIVLVKMDLNSTLKMRMNKLNPSLYPNDSFCVLLSQTLEKLGQLRLPKKV